MRQTIENSGVGFLPARKEISRARRPRHTPSSLVAFVTVATIAMVTAPGCHSGEDTPPPLPRIADPVVTARVLPPHAEPTLITKGRLPLVYIVQGAGTLRFSDLTSGVDLAQAAVQPRQIVRIDAKRGAMVGETALRPGALNTDHEYGIWLDPEFTGGELRNTIGKQAPPAPTSQPNSK